MIPYTLSTHASYNWSTNVNFLTVIQRKHSSQSSYNTQSNTMKPETGFANKPNQHLHMTSSFPSAKYSRHDARQFQDAKEKDHTELTTITVSTASTSPIHQDTLNTQLKCGKCGYSQNKGSYPTYRRDCYKCSKKGHFTSLSRRPRRHPPKDKCHPYCQRG